MDAMSATQTTAYQLLPLAKELDENKVTPGVLGFAVFAVMGVAVWMLMKSMNRHMGKVDFTEPAPATGPGSATEAATAERTEESAPGKAERTADEATPDAKQSDAKEPGADGKAGPGA
nr:hypothetical protein [Streptomyces sp. HNM0574]